MAEKPPLAPAVQDRREASITTSFATLTPSSQQVGLDSAHPTIAISASVQLFTTNLFGEPLCQWLTQAMFEEWGATAVTVASDGQEAVDLLCQAPSYKRFSLVLMDVQMPMLDGLEATRAIRAWEVSQRVQPRDALVIIGVSGDGDEDACGTSAIDAGMDAMLPKPVKRDELLNSLNDVVAARHAVELAA